MTMKAPGILLLLEKIENHNFCKKDLDQLIQYTYNISFSFLRKSFAKRLIPSFTDQHSFEDLAIDAIVPLFIKNKRGDLGIVKSLKNWNDPITNDMDAHFFLVKLVWKRTDQTITKYLKEIDPVFDKILKTLNLCIASNDIKKVRYFGSVYVTENHSTEITSNVPNNEFFNRIPTRLLANKQLLLFTKLFEYIKSETDFFPAIPLNLLVRKIKEMYVERYKDSLNNYTEQDQDFVYEALIQNEKNNIREKIETFYIPQKKITEKDAEYIMASFDDITEDLLNGGLNGSLYGYLKFRNNDLTSDEFYSKYHHIMNYLYKHLKGSLAKQFT